MLTLFGYGVTTRAIAERFGNCRIYDDKFSGETFDSRSGNAFLASALFDPEKSDLEVTSPGIPPSHPLIRKAKNLISEYDFFARSMPYAIWVTGTNGKTTTTDMIGHLLKERGAVTGGNIGTPLAKLDENAPMWVLETSSFTLHYTTIARPNIYIVLPITPDHVSWHGSFEAYEAAKLKPLALMEEGEAVILPAKYADTPTDAMKITYESSEDLATYFGIAREKIRFEEPFLMDALMALAVTKILFDEVDYEKINSYQIGKHRVEAFIDAKGRRWVNDSKATNADATLAALRGMEGKKIHLILGGDDKGAALEGLFDYMQGREIMLYAIGSNMQRLERLAKERKIEVELCEILENAVKKIDALHDEKSVAMLSPAAASLDQFASYAERGEKFLEFIENLS